MLLCVMASNTLIHMAQKKLNKSTSSLVQGKIIIQLTYVDTGCMGGN